MFTIQGAMSNASHLTSYPVVTTPTPTPTPEVFPEPKTLLLPSVATTVLPPVYPQQQFFYAQPQPQPQPQQQLQPLQFYYPQYTEPTRNRFRYRYPVDNNNDNSFYWLYLLNGLKNFHGLAPPVKTHGDY